MQSATTKALLLADDKQFIAIAHKEGLERAGSKVLLRQLQKHINARTAGKADSFLRPIFNKQVKT
jgi:hypothetical protein